MRTIFISFIMFQFLLSLFGCKSGSSASTTSREVGPFTIETITRTGKTWNMNYGRVSYTNVSYDVKYKGEAITMGDSLETNTGLPGIWRVFFLKDAPQPTLLLGSQSLYLIKEINDKAVVKPIHVQGSDFASIQWLDQEHGQPGIYREIYSSDQFDTEMELSGGRYMAISQALVLDTRTFEEYPFNTDNHLVDGYYKGGTGAVAFSPDSSQLVYYGSKYDEQDYNITFHALIVYNFRNGNHYAVPFDKDSFKLKDQFIFPEGWVNDYFEWQVQPDSGYKLVTRQQHLPLPRKGDILYQRNNGYWYVIEPADESLMPVLTEYIRKELNLREDQVHHVKEEYSNRTTFDVPGKSLVVQYGEYGEDLVFRDERTPTYSLENRELITRIAKGFDKILQK